MTDLYRAIPTDEITASFSEERKTRIASRAATIIAEEMALRDIRKSRQMTQEQVAEKLDGRQVYISRLENRSDAKLSTLRDYVRAIGGDLQLLVTFPEGNRMTIKDLQDKKG
jgi:DNA-binding XRE family transcriptional regulator